MRALVPEELSRFERLRMVSHLPIGLFEATGTQQKKSIIDANATIRDALFLGGMHDFNEQDRGKDHKRLIRAIDLSSGEPRDTKTSLYRPKTKNGDPRFWFYNAMLVSDHIYALAVGQDEVFLVDLSSQASSEVAFGFLRTSPTELLEAEKDLLVRLRHIASRGPLSSPRRGDTAVGAAVEQALGIQQNSSKSPDWHGIEIKSYRKGTGTRKTLFAQVAEWPLSPIKSSRELLEAHGYHRDGARRLNCQVDARGPNSQGLFLSVDLGRGWLLECVSQDNGSRAQLVWTLAKLNERIQEKHRRTAWVAAERIHAQGVELFRLDEVRLTRDPDLASLTVQLAAGKVSVDHLIKETSGKVSERGPLFKATDEALQSILTTTGVVDLQVN